MKRLFYLLCSLSILLSVNSSAQRNKASAPPQPLDSALFKNLEFRNIGPAFMSGRIADVAIDPTNESVWYVAVGSGGVWKTVNAGTTFAPIFDDQPVYSIGCVTIDPNNPFRIWVGTGENVGGRHAGFGDGIYKSENGGKSWTNMGLPNSEHISKIIVHPENSDVIYVASQGPLWSAGGDRGFFKSTDGGKTWNKTLGDTEYTGVTDIAIDPRDPNRIYAATWQHHRTTAAWMGGGEKSGIHLSLDGGETWKKLTSGLPDGKMGKIGLAVSPVNPDVVYAAIEQNRITGGVWRSSNRGGSWTKMSNTISGATGPHYYQELYASPHKFDRIYLMDSPFRMSEDGGKTFTTLSAKEKHVDNHAMAFKASDPNYVMVGTDGGLYESFDLGETWRFMENLPLTQFYKLALDDTEPFYNVYGGTQDNNTQGGPSRTDNYHGIRNADWKVVLFADGHQPATEPGNPDIMYAQWQQGNLTRIDTRTGEVVYIQPQPAEGEVYQRYNWDAPILVSPHVPSTIYHGSQRLWMSEDRGDTWIALSEDLTRNQERLSLPIMGGQQSWDSPWDVNAMSNYNTITSIAVSPKNKELIFVGTDDGLMQITTDGGSSWRKIELSTLGLPKYSYVNDIKADLHDENVVYAAFDNHKYGDYKPYLLKSTDKGVTWQKIQNGLGTKNLVWRIVQDHVEKNLLFAATEFGIYFSIDAGGSWTELTGGIPTISFRDIAIQKRENDLVAASFGRGFYVLDDYSALREVSKNQINQEASLFTPRKALWYIPRSILDFEAGRGSQGSEYYVAPNPDFGAVFTYYLKDEYKSLEKARQEKEKSMSGNIPFPGWEALEKETRGNEPLVYLEISNSEGRVIQRVDAVNKKGFNRVAWNLRIASKDPLQLDKSKGSDDGFLVAPGTYTASLSKLQNGMVTPLAGPVNVEVVPLYEGSLLGSSKEEVANFWRKYESTKSKVEKLQIQLTNATQTAEKLLVAAKRSGMGGEMIERIAKVKSNLGSMDSALNGNAAKNQVGEKNNPTVRSRLSSVSTGISYSTYGPTPTHEKQMQIVIAELNRMISQLTAIQAEMAVLAKQINQAEGPWIEGQD